MSEKSFIDALRALAIHPAARGLNDDAAVLQVADSAIVLTHDMIVEGVHYLPQDPPADVAWKLLAVNLSDLAAKGARPLGVLMGYGLAGDADWDAAFLAGLSDALAAFDVPLLGGDTVGLPGHAPRCFGLTAIGAAPASGAPSRSGACDGDSLYITGTIGDAGHGLQLLLADQSGPETSILAYRRPRPLLAEGQALAPHVHAMMDVSDGLLIDAGRMAEASGLSVTIALDTIPLSAAVAARGDDRDSRIAAATAGDDYQLLFAAPANAALPIAATLIGHFTTGSGLSLTDRDGEVPLPERLGYLHG